MPHSVITPHAAISTETDYPARVTLTQRPQPEVITYNESLVQSRDFDAADSEMLLKIAMAEAEGESVEGKALVMMVVLNRVWSEGFPDTVQEVIFQPRQFSVIADGGRYWTTEPDAGCYEALELVMQGWDESEGALYFESCPRSSRSIARVRYTSRAARAAVGTAITSSIYFRWETTNSTDRRQRRWREHRQGAGNSADAR